jgi:hypothetical protein
VSRQAKLTEAVRLELRLPEELAGRLEAQPQLISGKQETVVFRITPAADLRAVQTFTIRGTALQEGKYPVISETTVSVEFLPGAASSQGPSVRRPVRP